MIFFAFYIVWRIAPMEVTDALVMFISLLLAVCLVRREALAMVIVMTARKCHPSSFTCTN